jgi:transposase
MKKIYFLGIDVAKDSCAFCLLNANGSCVWSGQFDNNSPSIKRWLALLRSRPIELAEILFGFEATGAYSHALLFVLQQLGLAACQLNPAQIKYFGASLNRRTKNDPADAQLIARFLLERHPVPTQALSCSERQLRELVHEREARAVDLNRERNRSEKHQLLPFKTLGVLTRQRKECLSKLKTWIKTLDLAIEELVHNDPALSAQAKLLCSIPGIALCSAAKILSEIAGKDFKSAHQLALYAGLNPKENQSGHFKGKTTLSKIGNAFLRKALFMPASVASRCCPPIKLWIQQIKSRRPEFSKLAIRGAVMHKLIRIAFGVLKHQTPLDPTLAYVPKPLDIKDRIYGLPPNV